MVSSLVSRSTGPSSSPSGDILSLHATEIAVISSGLMGHLACMQTITLAYKVFVVVLFL